MQQFRWGAPVHELVMMLHCVETVCLTQGTPRADEQTALQIGNQH
jgi:hypothetical protein